MAAGILKSRQTRYAAYAGTYILVIIAVLGGVNFLANRYDKSVDTTANKQFSLSDQTIKVISKLPRDVHITYFDETQRFLGALEALREQPERGYVLHGALFPLRSLVLSYGSGGYCAVYRYDAQQHAKAA